jgi:iron complex transport system substrate-binding protein
MTSLSGWNDLQAVVSNEVYVADADMFTQPCASTLVNGIEVLAALFHPTVFKIPPQISHKVQRLTDSRSKTENLA